MKQPYRRTNRTNLQRIVLLAILVIAAAGIALAQGDDEDTLFVRYRGDISNLDPGLHNSLHDIGVADNIYCQLVRLTPGSADVEPDLATDWSISDDGLVYEFHLRDDVQWHGDYGNVTAEDVRFTYERLINPDFGSPSHFAFNMISEIAVPDAQTVRFVLSEPHAPLLSRLGYPWGTGIVNRQALEDFADDYTSNAVGCGPYRLEEWVPSERIVLVAHEGHYEYPEVPVTERVVLIPISDDSVAAGAMEVGEVSLGLFRDPQAVARLEDNSELSIDRTHQSAISSLFYRTDRPPFDELRVRQAIHYAIDKEELVGQVLPGVASVASSFIVPLAPGSTSDVVEYGYDPDRARELLAEAGYPDGFSVDLLSTQLQPWPLVSPIVQFYLEDVGIDVNMRQLEHGTYGAERGAGNFDMTVLTVTGPPDADTWMGHVHSTSVPPGINASFYANPEVDQLVERARAEMDADGRSDLYVRIQQIVMEDAAFMPLFHLGVQAISHESVRGFTTPIAHDFKLKHAYIER